CSLILRREDGRWHANDHMGALARFLPEVDVAILAYNPFMYGKWGVAPWLPVAIARAKAMGWRGQLALPVHEPYVPVLNWRWALMGSWQRAQLKALALTSELIFTSTEGWYDALGRLPSRPVIHLPVPSNLPDMRSEREAMRSELRLDPENLVLASL